LLKKQAETKSGRGGWRNGGRPKGSQNKATADIKAAAQKYTDQALQTLAQIMTDGESEAARVAAANAILDRGYGKPKQSVDVEADVKASITRIERVIVRPAN
jgi:phage gp46-like protein